MEEISAENIAQIYIKEIFIKHRVLAKIILDSVGTHDLRLISRNIIIVVLLGYMMIVSPNHT